MDLHSVLALVLATALLVAIPGPNVALIVATTLERGWRAGCATVLGTTLGVALQLGLVALGLAALMDHAAAAFAWARWLGVGFLLWLGWRAWARGGAAELPSAPAPRPTARLFARGALLACVNPKTLLFSAAFLPQFVRPEAGPAGIVLAAGLHLAVLLAGDMAWAAGAERARPLLARLGGLRHRLSGAFYAGAAIGLALARIGRQGAAP
ncbi:LysE family translocator [Oceanicella sp. SM1341]|uniref:LysE family translocator n=1 Tax=Oceanicella sp. SM1341 TaxID=1548889 RepID=UPI000E5331B7|nr:LysE family translocator [Oceanicella sp. SM1341]